MYLSNNFNFGELIAINLIDLKSAEFVLFLLSNIDFETNIFLNYIHLFNLR